MDNNILLAKIKEGDENSLEEIVIANMGLVKSIALRFCGRGTEYDDLVQIGSIGLVRAARSFDFSFGCMFSTYAVPLIIGEIKRFLRDDGIIKISRSTKSAAINVMHRKEDFCRKYGRDPTVGELASICNISREEIITALEAATPIASLNEKVGGESSETTLEYFIADNDNILEKMTDKIALSQAVSTLTELQQQIVHLRFFKDLSQQQTGSILGLTQVKVSREEKKIIAILKKIL